MRYSGLKVISEGLFVNNGWKPAWRNPEPKAEYDAIIIGTGPGGEGAAGWSREAPPASREAVRRGRHPGR